MKKILFSVFAVVAALTMFAFGKVEEQPKASAVYWVFTGNPNSASDIADPTKYTLAPGNQPTCNASTGLCNIFAEPQSGNPSRPNLATEEVSMRTFRN